jgi:hypothetical protein
VTINSTAAIAAEGEVEMGSVRLLSNNCTRTVPGVRQSSVFDGGE